MKPNPRPSQFSSLTGASLAALMAENGELKRQLAAKPKDGGDGEDDPENEDSPGDELDPADDSPTKKGKKKPVKKTAEDKDEQGDDVPGEPDRRHPGGPEEDDTAPRKDASYWSHAFSLGAPSASPEAILAGVKARRVMPPRARR